MGVCCCVPFCKSQSGKSNVSFHEFPNEETLRIQCITNISRKDLIKDIRDPEKPQTLEELEVINESDITVKNISNCDYVNISLTPTVPHCSLATIIGLCVRVKLEKYYDKKLKLDIILKEGTHSSSEEVSKQINDKERVAAAMENPNLRKIVEDCIKEE